MKISILLFLLVKIILVVKSSEFISLNDTAIVFDSLYPRISSLTYYWDENCKNPRYGPLLFICDDKECVMNTNDHVRANVYGACRDACYTYRNKTQQCKLEFKNLAPPSTWGFDGYNPRGPITDGQIMTISGNYLRSSTNSMDSVIIINQDTLEEKKAQVLDDWKASSYNPTKITIKLPPGYGMNYIYFGDSKNIKNKVVHNRLQFNYASPSISNITIKNQVVSIFGNNFSNDIRAIKVYVGDSISDYNITSLDHHLVKLNKLKYYPCVESIRVEVSDDFFSNYFELFIRPVPERIFQNSSISRYNSGNITIIGSYLNSYGRVPIIVNLVDYFNGISYPCSNSFHPSPGDIQCTLEKGSAKDLVLELDINFMESINRDVKFTYGLPKFSDSSILNVQNGSQFIVFGLNFGSLDDNSTELFIVQDRNSKSSSSLVSPTITSISKDERELTFTLPNICDDYIYLSMIVNGLQTEKNLLLEPKPIYFVAPSVIFTNNGSSLEISKLYKCNGTMKQAQIVVDNSSISGHCTIKSNTQISCNVGPGTGEHYFKLYIDGKLGLESLFKYAAPKITSHSIQYDNGSVALYGFNFGTNSSKCFLTISNQPVNCTVINDTVITFEYAASSTSVVLNINLFIDGIEMESEYVITTAGIYEIEWTKSKLSTSGGVLVINCSNLPESTQIITVTINGFVNVFSIIDQLGALYIPLPNGIGSFNTSIYYENQLLKSFNNLKYLTPVFKHSNLLDLIVKSKSISSDKDQLEFRLYGDNFGQPFKLSIIVNSTSSNSNELIFIPLNNCSLIYHNSASLNDTIICSISTDHFKQLQHPLSSLSVSLVLADIEYQFSQDLSQISIATTFAKSNKLLVIISIIQIVILSIIINLVY